MKPELLRPLTPAKAQVKGRDKKMLSGENCIWPTKTPEKKLRIRREITSLNFEVWGRIHRQTGKLFLTKS